MDAFYASVEQRDFPELRGKCIAVGGSSDRGVVATASYEARKFGVKSAMSSVVAKRLCPELIFVKPRFDIYKEVALQIRAIFLEYTDEMEPLSLDEAYLDVTHNKMNNASATLIAEEIRQKIVKKTGLTASAGVSFNKFLAKTASDFNKPNGIFIITPNMASDFVATLPIGRFHGIGKVTAQKMKDKGIHTGADLRNLSLADLMTSYGKVGSYYYNIARGIDERSVVTSRVRKSVGSEHTFVENINELAPLQQALQPLITEIWQWCLVHHTYGRTLTVKIKYDDFVIHTKSTSSVLPIKEQALFYSTCYDLLVRLYEIERNVRLLGVAINNLVDFNLVNGRQLEIDFTAAENIE